MSIKRIIILLSIAVGLAGMYCGKKSGHSDTASKGSISVSGAWALYPMMIKWAEEYQNVYPDVTIDISAGGAGKGMADALANLVDIGMISREIQLGEIDKGAWYLSVCRDGVVATIHQNNPVWANLKPRGITQTECQKIWITQEITDWGVLIGQPKKPLPLNVYTRSDACGAAETWAAFLGKKQEDLKGIGIYGDPGLLEAVRQDESGIAYNNINYIYDQKTRHPHPGTRVMPLDINGNGRLEPEEDFYADRDSLIVAIKDGRYPAPPARTLYVACKGKPQNPVVNAFLRWILEKGQAFTAETGYIALSTEEINQQLGKMTDTPK